MEKVVFVVFADRLIIVAYCLLPLGIQFFARNAGVLLEGGDSLFVDNAAGFARLNLAMPRSLLAEGLKRITEAVKAYKPKK